MCPFASLKNNLNDILQESIEKKECAKSDRDVLTEISRLKDENMKYCARIESSKELRISLMREAKNDVLLNVE